MAEGEPVNTLNVLIKTTMSRDIAEMVKERFEDMGSRGMSVSDLDCVYFDAALEVLGEEQAYYGYGDDEWREILAERAEMEKRYRVVVDDVTKKLKKALEEEERNAGGD